MGQWEAHTMKGPALIIVILSLLMIFMLSGESSAISALSFRQALLQNRLIKNHYEAESQLSILKWKLMGDLQVHKNRNNNQSLEEEDSEERYRADGRVQTLTSEDFMVKTQINDAFRGLNLQGEISQSRALAFKRLQQVDEGEELVFIDELSRYTQNNDAYDISAYDPYDLPRKSSMEYGEEIYWIPELREFVDLALVDQQENPESLRQLVRPFIPDGVRLSRNLKSSFFSADINEIMMRLNLAEDEILQVKQARTAWFEESIALEESIPELLPRIKRFFSFKESGVYLLKVKVSDQEGLNTVVHEEILQLNNRGPKRFGKFKGMQYWRRTSF
ncbi:hypothetical protein PQO03_17765 [Lentisphaera profundi]|uniref:Type II secretion system protein K n=1 Tax=Lentisphaera profundi TaxID=1658616 RepID=A0ABY7VWV4_9BACT|nr:hypothetical protein [Lentisphaera profundi]WDE97675.1 hypothetical protein PQO03_17765 [Lentisphaera profundi]